MYFVYVDESGNTGPDPVQHFFVLAALAASMERCLQVQEQLIELKLRFFPAIQPEEIEIKGRNLVHGKDFFENVRLETRQAILHEIYALLREQPLWLFATVMDKTHPTLQPEKRDWTLFSRCWSVLLDWSGYHKEMRSQC